MEYTLTEYRRYKDEVSTQLDGYGEPYFETAFEFEVAEHPGWVFGVGSEEMSWAYESEGMPREIPERLNEELQYGWSNWGPYWNVDEYIYEQVPKDPGFNFWDNEEDPDHPFMAEIEGMFTQPWLNMDELRAKIPNFVSIREDREADE